MYNVTLLEGNGTSLFGGGSIQLEYDKWAQEESNQVNLNHLICDRRIFFNTKEKKIYKELNVNGRVLHHVSHFRDNRDSIYINWDDLDWGPGDFYKDYVKENLIILTFPFIDKTDTFIDEIEKVEWYRQLFEFHKYIYKEKSNIIVICYDYDEKVVLNNLGAKYPLLFEYVNTIWVNNQGNPLVNYLARHKYNPVDLNKFYFECPQFIADSEDDSLFERIKNNWRDPDDMVKNQLYFSGRNLDWKGWKEVRDTVWRSLIDAGFDFNLDFNGFIIPTKECKLEKTNLSEAGFRKHFENRERYFGKFNPADLKDLSSQPAFTVYFTMLQPGINFFPEYTTVDAVMNGSILIVPKYYFKHFSNENRGIFPQEVTPESAGMIAWPENPTEYEVKNLGILLNKIQNDKKLYNQYREKALKFMLDFCGANSKIKPLLIQN